MYAGTTSRPLLPSLTFTALSLFNLLKLPLDNLIRMFARVQDSLVSIRRVKSYLQKAETRKYKQLPRRASKDSSRIGFQHATFVWGTESDGNNTPKNLDHDFALKNLNLDFKVGKLNVITGATGSGKLSMLLALLGEMTLLDGVIHMPEAKDRESFPADFASQSSDTVAYCAQEAWLFNDTIWSNILFGSLYMANCYETVLHACALGPDLQSLPRGDLSLVGEQGVTISGGQKQRIALARAIYSNASYILLDDCLSAVDSHTAKWIFGQCINGFLVRGRTRILVTHNVALTAANAEFMVVLRKGDVIAAGNPSELTASGLAELDGLIIEEAVEIGNTGNDEVHVKTPDRSTAAQDFHKEKDSMPPKQANTPDPPMLGLRDIQVDNKALRRNVPGYLAAMGGLCFWVLLAFFFVAQQVGSVATNWWVRELSYAYAQSDSETPCAGPCRVSSHAARSPSLDGSGVDTCYYFGVYAIIIVAYLVISLLRLLLVSDGSLRASANIH